ncbi:MAG: TetR/AcrR family transcriptional regulator [Pseudomonadota bacterium]
MKSPETKSARKTVVTREAILEATKAVLRERGYAGLSTRDVAAVANMPMSQIHYHFGSKQGLILALFEYQNVQLLERQQSMFDDPNMPLSLQWKRACDYLDEDLESGYVRVLQELLAAGWSNPEIAHVVREGLEGWNSLLVEIARRAEKRFGSLGGFKAEELGTLVGMSFIGAESFILSGVESRKFPVRKALRRVGEIIRNLEKQSI